MGTEDLISVFGPSLSLLSCATICVQNFPKKNSKPFFNFPCHNFIQPKHLPWFKAVHRELDLPSYQ